MEDTISGRLFRYFAAPGAAFLFAAGMAGIASAAEGQGQGSQVDVSSEVYNMTPSQAETTFQRLRSVLKAPAGQVQGVDGSAGGSTNGGFPERTSPPTRGGGNSPTSPSGSPQVGGGSGGDTGGPHCPPDMIPAGNRCIRNPGGPASGVDGGSGSVSGSGTGASTGTIAGSGTGSSTSTVSNLCCPPSRTLQGDECVFQCKTKLCPDISLPVVPAIACSNTPPPACPAGEISVPGPAVPTPFAGAPNGHGLAAVAGAASQVTNRVAALTAKNAYHCIPLPQPPMACPAGGQAVPDPNMNVELSQSGFVVEHWVCPAVGIGWWCPHIVGPVYPGSNSAFPGGGILGALNGAINAINKAAETPQLVMGGCLPQQFQGSGYGYGGQNCRNLPPGVACAGGGAMGAGAPAAAGGAVGIMQPIYFPHPYKYCAPQLGGLARFFDPRAIAVCQPGATGEQAQFFALSSQVSGRMPESDGAAGLWNNQGAWQSVFMTRVKNVTIEGLSDARQVGQILDFETDNPAMSCLNGESVDLWTAPKEFPGMMVAHNGDQGSQCAYGTWTFPAPQISWGSFGAAGPAQNNLAGFFGGL